jgi:FtsP/CotA-like multicopper oxidase with cupredoxin domain
VVNASNTGYLALAGGAPMLIGTDQGLAAAASTPPTIVLAPGDRAELAYRMPADGAGFDVVTTGYSMHGGALDATEHDPSHGAADTPSAPEDDAPAGTPLFHVALEGPRRAPPERLPWAFDGALPAPDPGTTDVLWVLQGSDRGWMINGETFPDVTVPEVTLGADVVIEVRNLSPTHHPFHLHGMAFEVLSRDGVAPSARALEDTIDLPIRGVARLLLHADNPGEWMAHCHILPHAHGMMTVLRVAEP